MKEKSSSHRLSGQTTISCLVLVWSHFLVLTLQTPPCLIAVVTWKQFFWWNCKALEVQQMPLILEQSMSERYLPYLNSLKGKWKTVKVSPASSIVQVLGCIRQCDTMLNEHFSVGVYLSSCWNTKAKKMVEGSMLWALCNEWSRDASYSQINMTLCTFQFIEMQRKKDAWGSSTMCRRLDASQNLQ